MYYEVIICSFFHNDVGFYHTNVLADIEQEMHTIRVRLPH